MQEVDTGPEKETGKQEQGSRTRDKNIFLIHFTPRDHLFFNARQLHTVLLRFSSGRLVEIYRLIQLIFPSFSD